MLLDMLLIFRCFLCNKPNNLIRVPTSAMIQCLITRRIILVENTRCCQSHIQDGKFNETDLRKIEAFEKTTELGQNQLQSMITGLCNEIKLLEKRKRTYKTHYSISNSATKRVIKNFWTFFHVIKMVMICTFLKLLFKLRE